MTKYDPLLRFLRRQRQRDEVTLRFHDIERIIGAILPKAAARSDWWSNAPGASGVQCRAWLGANYHAFPGAQETVTFRRICRLQAQTPMSRNEPTVYIRSE